MSDPDYKLSVAIRLKTAHFALIQAIAQIPPDNPVLVNRIGTLERETEQLIRELAPAEVRNLMTR